LTPLESSFSTNDASKTTFSHENLKRKIAETIPVNIGSNKDKKKLYILETCTEQEKERFIALFQEFKDVFVWSYADLKGFDPGIVQHAIPIKENLSPVRKRQRPMNLALESTIRNELDKLLASPIIFPVKYFEWVANLVPVQKQNGDIR